MPKRQTPRKCRKSKESGITDVLEEAFHGGLLLVPEVRLADGVVVADFFKSAEHLSYRIPTQGISLIGTIDRDLRNRTALFHQSKFAVSHEQALSSL